MHAEIAGSGFGGLVAAVALARRGWTVRVHERAPSLRAEGFGIAIHANGLRVLDALGIGEKVRAGGLMITALESRDSRGRVTSRISPKIPSFRISRHHLVRCLADEAEALGVEIRTSSPVAGATPEGVLVLEDGTRLEANLVIGADGVFSKVRDSLGLIAEQVLLADGAMRLLVPREGVEAAAEREGGAAAVENWSGQRRIIYSPVNRDEAYIAMSCLASDTPGRAVPVDVEAWSTSFPHMAPLFEHMARAADWSGVRWVQFQVVRLKSWSRGRVAVLGDAAHAMPPNLGQGGGCAMMNGLSLAAYLGHGSMGVEEALAIWEAAERPLVEHTQTWSTRYSRLTTWPPALRSMAFKVVGSVPWLKAQAMRTTNHVPTGSVIDGT